MGQGRQGGTLRAGAELLLSRAVIFSSDSQIPAIANQFWEAYSLLHSELKITGKGPAPLQSSAASALAAEGRCRGKVPACGCLAGGPGSGRALPACPQRTHPGQGRPCPGSPHPTFPELSAGRSWPWRSADPGCCRQFLKLAVKRSFCSACAVLFPSPGGLEAPRARRLIKILSLSSSS